MSDIESYFKSLEDPKRQAFNRRIINTQYYIHGLRTADIRKGLKLIDIDEFLKTETFTSYEMMFLYTEAVCTLKYTGDIIRYLNTFLVKADNWAIIDNLCTHLKHVDKDVMLGYVRECLDDDREFTRRFGIVMFITVYLDKQYLDLFFEYFDKIDKSQYYVMMAVAWAIATAYIEYPDYTLYYLKNNHLDKVTFNKALSKICDSYRVSDENKKMIRAMKRR